MVSSLSSGSMLLPWQCQCEVKCLVLCTTTAAPIDSLCGEKLDVTAHSGGSEVQSEGRT